MKKIFKKSIIILSFFVLFFHFNVFAQPGGGPWLPGQNPNTNTSTDNSNPLNFTTTTPVQLQNQQNTPPLPADYQLLTPLPDLENFDETEACAFGKYLNILINLIIAILAVIAVVMIVIGGLQYMTSELISSKEAGIERVQNALIGLLIALSAFLLLKTINPDLLNVCLDIDKVDVIVFPDSGDDTIDPNFSQGIRTYSSDASVTPSILSAAEKLRNGWQIVKINVYSNSNQMQIDLKKGNQIDNTTYLSMRPGKNGYAPPGTARVRDGKTPIGSWRIIGINYTPGVAQFNREGSNMGAAFWHLNPTNSGERGIGIHGNKTGTLGVTNGCIRLKNADILALQPYIRTGIPVIVH